MKFILKFFTDETYLLYNFILIFVFTFSYLAEHLDNRDFRFFSRIIVFLTLTIPASLRYETGTDYGNYVLMFYSNASLRRHEFLWRSLNFFIRDTLGLSVQWLFVFSSILIYYPICFKIKRKGYCLSVCLYLILTFYFKSYNILRQMVAVSFILWAFIRFEDKKYIKAIILFVIAYLFHKSTILILPVFLISYIKIPGKFLPPIILFLGFVIILKVNVLVIALDILAKLGSRYARFAKSQFFTSRSKLGTGLGVLVKLSFSILSIVLYSRIEKKNPEKRQILNFSLVYFFSYILAAQFIILGRVRDLFIFVPLLVSANAINVCGKYRKIVLLMLLSLNILLFEKDIGKQTRDTFSNSIYPYYSIFYEGEIL